MYQYGMIFILHKLHVTAGVTKFSFTNKSPNQPIAIDWNPANVHEIIKTNIQQLVIDAS